MSTDASQPSPAEESPRKASLVRRMLQAIAAVIVIAVAFLLAFPAPIDPVAYTPPAAPALEGVLSPNRDLEAVEILAAESVVGPEDVDIDAEGRIYGATADGKIVRLLRNGQVEIFAETGGRPLGLDFDPAGNLIVADGMKGLLSVDPSGNVTTLLVAVDDMPLGFADDVVVGRDGTIYFSDASTQFGVGDFMLDMLEARPHGRLIRFDPAAKKAEVLLDDLYFANGVALASDERFVIVNETWRYRITRYWLRGERAGESDTFVENLPGFPDGVSDDDMGTFWVAIFTLRNEMADWLSPRPFLKELIAKLPAPLQPRPQPYGLVLAIGEDGEVLRSLHDPTAQYGPVTSVEREGEYLYLGSLTDRGIGRLRIPDSVLQALPGGSDQARATNE